MNFMWFNFILAASVWCLQVSSALLFSEKHSKMHGHRFYTEQKTGIRSFTFLFYAVLFLAFYALFFLSFTGHNPRIHLGSQQTRTALPTSTSQPKHWRHHWQHCPRNRSSHWLLLPTDLLSRPMRRNLTNLGRTSLLRISKRKMSLITLTSQIDRIQISNWI